MPKILDQLRLSRAEKMNDEHRRGIGGGNSDVVLIVPYRASISDADRDYCIDRLKQIREEFPDVVLLFLTNTSKDKWSSFVLDSSKDIFPIGMGSTSDALTPLIPLLNRIGTGKYYKNKTQWSMHFEMKTAYFSSKEIDKFSVRRDLLVVRFT